MSMPALPAKQSPVVSVIIPIYNRATVVEKTLNSVKVQTYRPIELILINDGSSDQSEEIIQHWVQKNADEQLNVVYRRQENLGAPAARNFGMRLCSGEYLQFLDSDDTLAPEKLAQQVEALEHSDADIAVCDFQYVTDDGKLIRAVRNAGPLRGKLASGWSVSICAPVIRKTAIWMRVWWDEKMMRNQDMDFLFKVFCISRAYVYTPGLWCDYVQHDGAQISDRYRTTAPEFSNNIMSLLRFAYQMRRELPGERQIMLAKCILRISRGWLLYWPKTVVKIVLRRFKASFGSRAETPKST